VLKWTSVQSSSRQMRVDDHVRPQFGKSGLELVGVSQVRAGAVEGDDVTAQAGAQIAAELTGGAEDGEGHGVPL
jgi:hypothetical protein